MSSDDEFQKMVKDLQQKIEKDEEQRYSKTVIGEYRHPINFGVIKDANAVGIIKGSCGDTMKISLKIVDDKISDARFWTDGCGASIACGNMLIKMIKGELVETADKITSMQLIENLDGLPEENLHCTVLAVHTLKQAITNYHKVK